MATAASPPQFCKVFLPHLASQRLRIPPAFVKHIAGLAGPPPITVSLQGPGGGVWYTDLVTVSGGLFLDTGWKEFIHDHSLEKWDFLVFRYEGDMRFSVLVFDRSACQKVTALSARPFEHRDNALEEAVSARPSEETGPSEDMANASEDTGNVTEEAVLAGPSEDMANVSEERLSAQISEDADGTGEDTLLRQGRGDVGEATLTEDGGLLVQPTEGRDSVGEETVLVRPAEGGDELPVDMDNGEADKVREDSGDGDETVLVRPSEDRGNAGLARPSEDRDREEAVLDSGDGVIVKRKRGRPRKNKRDDCVVTEGSKRKRGRPRKEPMEGTRKEPMEGPKRSRGRPRKSMSDDCVNPEGTPPLKEGTPCLEDHCLVREKRQHGVRSQRRPVTSEEVDKVILKAKAFKSKYPFCVVQMYDSYVYYGFALGIPLKFARKHLPLPGGNVILCDPSGTRWDVKYVIYRRHGCFNAGWLKFSVTNNLERGDVCIFELVKNCELRVHIFRVVEEITPLIRAFQGRRRRFSKG